MWNLKDEEEVKEYLENLGTEYRFGCYHEKIPETCHLLGDFFEAIDLDWRKAARLYQKNCDDGKYGHSCFKYGHYLYLGKGGLKKNFKAACDYYEKGCNNNYPDSCYNTGIMRHEKRGEEGVPRSNKQALEFFIKGCGANNPTSCYYASEMYLTEGGDAVPRDPVKAFKFANKACALGEIFGCVNLMEMYEKGEGTAQDLEKAKALKLKIQDHDNQHNLEQPPIIFGEGG